MRLWSVNKKSYVSPCQLSTSEPLLQRNTLCERVSEYGCEWYKSSRDTMRKAFVMFRLGFSDFLCEYWLRIVDFIKQGSSISCIPYVFTHMFSTCYVWWNSPPRADVKNIFCRLDQANIAGNVWIHKSPASRKCATIIVPYLNLHRHMSKFVH